MSFKCGFVGLVGEPNAGKSSLLNFLVEERVSIVSSKPQTTRRRVLGIVNESHAQMIFVDAPGLIEAPKGLNAFLQKEAQEVGRESDVLLAVLSLDSESPESVSKVIQMVKAHNKPWMACITKIDLGAFQHRSLRIREMLEAAGAKSVIAVSLKQEQESETLEDQKSWRREILENLSGLLPESPKPLYDVELFTPETLRGLSAEVIRERCFENLHQEVPYQIAVRIHKFDEDANPVPRVSAEILVAREKQRSIVIGKGGERIKKIGTEARLEIQKLMNQKIFLDLHVQVSEDWMSNPQIMKALGYSHE